MKFGYLRRNFGQAVRLGRLGGMTWRTSLEGEQDRLHTKFLVGLRFHAESPLRCRLGLPEIQSTHLTSSFTTFDECRECGAAFSHALRGHRSDLIRL